MRLGIDGIDGPDILADNAPIFVELVRQIPGPDRPDYWIAALDTALDVTVEKHHQTVTHLILAPR
jgi:hypothetical protein